MEQMQMAIRVLLLRYSTAKHASMAVQFCNKCCLCMKRQPPITAPHLPTLQGDVGSGSILQQAGI